MIIKNREWLINNTSNINQRRSREAVLRLLEGAILSVQPTKLLNKQVRAAGKFIYISGNKLDTDKINRIIVVGAGKASGYLAEALEEKIGGYIKEGVVAVLPDTSRYFRTSKIKIVEAAHPVPDVRSVQAADKILKLVEGASKDDLVICLFSGGGSSLLAYPPTGIALDDIKSMSELLLSSGANIVEVNTVRKHLSQIAGGRLARLAYPAQIISLIISDVVGDRLDTISSGPTAPDGSSFKDCLDIIGKYDLNRKTPKPIMDYIEKGVNSIIEETPKIGDPVFKKVKNIIIGSNRIALRTIISESRKIGLSPLLISSQVEGDAREFGVFLVSIVKEIVESGKPVKRPALVICGGETTVTLTKPGLGGRNQTIVLSALTKLGNLDNVTVCCAGTDGIDGVSKAAGAIADKHTLDKAVKMGLDLNRFLLSFNSNVFFSTVGDEIITGPTGTNVNDIYLALVI